MVGERSTRVARRQTQQQEEAGEGRGSGFHKDAAGGPRLGRSGRSGGWRAGGGGGGEGQAPPAPPAAAARSARRLGAVQVTKGQCRPRGRRPALGPRRSKGGQGGRRGHKGMPCLGQRRRLHPSFLFRGPHGPRRWRGPCLADGMSVAQTKKGAGSKSLREEATAGVGGEGLVKFAALCFEGEAGAGLP